MKKHSKALFTVLALWAAGCGTSEGAADAAGAAGATGAGTGGMGTNGSGGRGGSAGAAGSTPNQAPVIPPVSGDCPTFATGTVTVAGLAGISLQVGPKSQGTAPLLFYWHGTGSQASEVNLLMPAAVRDEILSEGGVIVSFQGSLGTGGDCSGTATFSRDDFVVADQIAACAVRDYGVDRRRIYTTGCSAGGLQAGCMGAMRSSYIAAVAPNSGGEVVPQAIQDPTRIPSVMTMHGGPDDMVIVSFATTSMRYDAQMKGAGAFVVNCNHGGGHCQAPAALYAAAWQFMKDHPFGVAPEPYASMLPAIFPPYCAEF
jgi:poly(3-hydroxybutyrate) depolymerase